MQTSVNLHESLVMKIERCTRLQRERCTLRHRKAIIDDVMSRRKHCIGHQILATHEGNITSICEQEHALLYTAFKCKH